MVRWLYEKDIHFFGSVIYRKETTRIAFHGVTLEVGWDHLEGNCPFWYFHSICFMFMQILVTQKTHTKTHIHVHGAVQFYTTDVTDVSITRVYKILEKN